MEHFYEVDDNEETIHGEAQSTEKLEQKNERDLLCIQHCKQFLSLTDFLYANTLLLYVVYAKRPI